MKNNRFMKIICFVVIQAYLLVNISLAGEVPICNNSSLAQNTLSPALNINIQDINFLFSSVCQNPEQTKTLKIKAPSQKRQSGFKDSFLIVKFLAFGLVLSIGAMHLLNIFHSNFTLPDDPLHAIILTILFMPIILFYSLGAVFTVIESSGGNILRKAKSAFLDLLYLVKADLQYKLYRLRILKNIQLKQKTDIVLDLIFSHAENGILISKAIKTLSSDNLTVDEIKSIIDHLASMNIIDIDNDLIMNNLMHREYLHYIAKTINKKLNFQMPDKELYSLTIFFQKKSYFIGIRENLVYSIPYLYLTISQLLLNGFGIEISKVITDMSQHAFIIQFLLNFLLVARLITMPSTGLKLPFSKTILISEYNQFNHIEEAFIRAFNNGDIPQKMIVRSRSEIIGIIYHESIHNVMDKYLGSKQNIKLTTTIQSLILEQEGIIENNFDISIKPQKDGKIIDLVNKGRQIESKDLSDKEKISIAQEEAINISNPRYGTEREPAWSYCFGYILYGILYERAQKEESYDNIWKLIQILTDKENQLEEDTTEKEPLNNILIRLSSAAAAGSFATWLLLLLAKNGISNPDLTIFDTILTNTFIISLITAIGYLTGHLISLAKYEIKNFMIRMFSLESILEIKAKLFKIVMMIGFGSLFGISAYKTFEYFQNNNMLNPSLSDGDLFFSEVMIVGCCSAIGIIIGLLTSQAEPKLKKTASKLKEKAAPIVKISPRNLWKKFQKNRETKISQEILVKKSNFPTTQKLPSAFRFLKNAEFSTKIPNALNQHTLINQAI